MSSSWLGNDAYQFDKSLVRLDQSSNLFKSPDLTTRETDALLIHVFLNRNRIWSHTIHIDEMLVDVSILSNTSTQRCLLETKKYTYQVSQRGSIWLKLQI